MPNEKGWWTKEEMLETELPCYNPITEKWSHIPYDLAVLLTRSRCKQLKMPALRNGYEKPSAFFYNNKPNDKYRYVPLYDRTDVLIAGEIARSELYDREIMESE